MMQEGTLLLNAFTFNIISILRGGLGMIVLIAIAYIISENKKAINWKIVGIGLLIQLVLALGILKIEFIQEIFEFIGKIFIKIIDATNAGTGFIFNSFVTGKIEIGLINFAVKILPTIIFFSALTSLLFYTGLIQLVVKFFAKTLCKFLGLSGAESLSVSGNIFLGQTESPLLIKEYLKNMSRSEILLVMSGGMATMAGGILAIYIDLLGGTDPIEKLKFAKHLLAASVMAAPGVVVISKIIIPETTEIDNKVEVTKEKIGKNVLDAISNGTQDGLRLAVNVGAMILVFMSLIALTNYIFFKIGDVSSINNWISSISNGQYKSLSIQFVLGYSLSPLMWLIGVESTDIALVGQMLGEKLVLTEFIGYDTLKKLKGTGALTSEKSVIMATYILCGFANISSIGIQIGGIGSLVPEKRALLSELGLKALIAGAIASLLSATIVGMFF